jgi:hypothetical protein|tara:strand:- start:2767 stop:2976 length:210 start_codon:yes stop_codon:yes gene_type:complete
MKSIKRLADKGVVGEWPPRGVPFLFALIFFLGGYFGRDLVTWADWLYFVAGFCVVWGILHWIVVWGIRR